MFVLFGVLEVELDVATHVIVGLVDGQFESFAFLVSVLEDFLFLFFVKNDINVDSASQSTEEAGDFILNLSMKYHEY